MTFDDITNDGRLWAVRYDGCIDNVLDKLFDQWNDIDWLRNFFRNNMNDLTSYFHITDVNEAIADTIEDSGRLECMIMDLSPSADLDTLFRPLNNYQTSAMLLDKEKARLKRYIHHTSWLRIYAIRLSEGAYIITGGAIKLTATMEERTHTATELKKMECVRNFLLAEGIVDNESFIDFYNAN
ncbi:hypothetical protein NG821_00195 [Prevotella cerevisiae]|uniref:Uncharacterized protein n=1 Tax=Segatella cerevisiae TaxID=2053716 RepID=A0ABT1BU28_9BACT|nr:hypothetical protein [Segatella cerevisiae]MCO6024280.1 hypothetical protein [Segatella cerevisiae]